MKMKQFEDEVGRRNDATYLLDRNKNVEAGLQQDEELKALVSLLKIAKRSGNFVWWETGKVFCFIYDFF